MNAGYDVLLEKPMAHTLEGCVQLVQAAERTGRVLQICHVLRYAPFWRKLHELLEEGVIGEIVTVEHRENVAYWHMAHSFVRGNWRNKALSSPMILAKCCHDLDVLVWNLAQPVERLSSVGSLMHFRPETVGPEIPARCTDGCPIEASCPFSAIGIYVDYERTHPDARQRLQAAGLDPDAPDFWPFNVLSPDVSRAGREQAIATGPYGRCVYHCDNDVVDHQMVLMELASGASVSLVMHGHSNVEHRSMRYDGTKGTLRPGRWTLKRLKSTSTAGKVSKSSCQHPPLATAAATKGSCTTSCGAAGGNGAAHHARVSLESHLLAFAAEEARLTHQVIEMAEYRARAKDSSTLYYRGNPFQP